MQRPRVRDLAKYFIHGAGFTALLAIAALISAFFLALLSAVGTYIGIIIGLAILVVLVGVANTYVTQLVWFRVETSVTKYLYQGILLFTLLALVYVPLQYFYIQLTHIKSIPPLLAIAILIIADSFINGYLGKRAAAIWQLPDPNAPSIFRSNPTPIVSPAREAMKPTQTESLPTGLVNPEELQREESKLELLLKHRQRSDLLNPEALDHQIEVQKRTVETLRQALTTKNP